jgi:hypothetical protein
MEDWCCFVALCLPIPGLKAWPTSLDVISRLPMSERPHPFGPSRMCLATVFTDFANVYWYVFFLRHSRRGDPMGTQKRFILGAGLYYKYWRSEDVNETIPSRSA